MDEWALVCQIHQQSAASKIVEGHAVRDGETSQLQSFPNQEMEEIKNVGINVLGGSAVANQRL